VSLPRYTGAIVGVAIGIDLGTTYTCAAVDDGSGPRVIQSRLGYTTIPSIVAFDDAGAPVVGQPAEQRMILNPAETVYGSKRLLGRAFGTGAQMEFQPHFHYELVPGDDGAVAANINGSVTSLVEVAGHILRECKEAAEGALGSEVDRAVVTVPAYFNESQRSCVRRAGGFAGLKVARLLSEPTAAAIAFGATGDQLQRVLVFDLGGGTFDISVVRVENARFTVEAVDGDSFLGGIDFDQLLVGHILDRLAQTQGGDYDPPEVDLERLRKAAQQAKHELSNAEHAMITVPHITAADGSTFNVDERVSRADLEGATRPLVDHCLALVDRTLRKIKLTPKDIDALLLVGGQTRMPLVQRRLEECLGRPPSKRVHPDEAVALGAAIVAAAHERKEAPKLEDVVPMSISVAVGGGRIRKVVMAGTPLPHSAELEFMIPAEMRVVRLAVMQGDEVRARDNAYLGAIVLDGPESDEPARCELQFKLDREGILGVLASVPDWGPPRFIDLDRSVELEPLLAQLGDPYASAPRESSSIGALPKGRGLAQSILRRLGRRRRA
jgi:molecular chaperone DnaK